MPDDRVILHCDLNNFFASVECIGRPDLKARPVAVCGDPEKRHGIILAKNEQAKKYGIRTGEPLATARVKCPQILLIPAHFEKYMHYSGAMRDLYRRYTDKIESFGIDECWLDVTNSGKLFGSGETIANELRALSKKELGLTISAGVSYNKTFAKMGSDYKKPDAVTCISRENYKELLWGLPVKDFMFVGASTAQRLRLFGICTVGDLATAPLPLLEKHFGLPGLHLRETANGFDPSPVADDSYRRPPESIGNSVTCPYDLTNDDQARTVLFMLCDSVATRLRSHGMKCRGAAVTLRSKDLSFCTKQFILPKETFLSTALFDACYAVYRQMRAPGEELRGLGVRAEKLRPARAMQISLFDDSLAVAKKERLEETVDSLRTRFGRGIIGGALYLAHPDLTEDHPLGHRIRPGGFDDREDDPGKK